MATKTMVREEGHQEVESGGILSLRPALFTNQCPGQSSLDSEEND